MFNSSNDSSSNGNQTFDFEMPLDIIMFGSIFYALIFLIGVTGNLLVIFVLAKERELRNFTNYLLANLSLSDLFVLMVCVPSAFHDLLGMYILIIQGWKIVREHIRWAPQHWQKTRPNKSLDKHYGILVLNHPVSISAASRTTLCPEDGS